MYERLKNCYRGKVGHLLVLLIFVLASATAIAEPRNNSTYFLQLLMDPEVVRTAAQRETILNGNVMTPNQQSHLLTALMVKFRLIHTVEEGTAVQAHIIPPAVRKWIERVTDAIHATSELRTGFPKKVARVRWLWKQPTQTKETPSELKLYESLGGSTPEKVKALGKILRTPGDPIRRHEAAILLTALLHDEPVTQLAHEQLDQALQKGDPLCRRLSVRGLAESPLTFEAGTIAIIGKVMTTDPSFIVRYESAMAMASLDGERREVHYLLRRKVEPGSEALRESLLDMKASAVSKPDPQEVMVPSVDRAEGAFLKLVQQEAIPWLEKALANDPDPLVRQEAAWALGELDASLASRLLQIAQISDDSEDVKIAAAQATRRFFSGNLSRHEDPIRLLWMGRQLTKTLHKGLSSKSEATRMISALSFPPMRYRIEEPKPMTDYLKAETDPGVRWAILRGLSMEPNLAMRCPADATKEIIELDPILKDLQHHPNPYVRAEAAAVIERLAENAQFNNYIGLDRANLQRIQAALTLAISNEVDPIVKAVLHRTLETTRETQTALSSYHVGAPETLRKLTEAYAKREEIRREALVQWLEMRKQRLPHSSGFRENAPRLLPTFIMQAVVTQTHEGLAKLETVPAFANGGFCHQQLKRILHHQTKPPMQIPD